MERRSLQKVLPAVLALALTGAPAHGKPAAEATKSDQPSSGAAAPDVDPKARAVFDKMAAFLSQAPKLSVTVESGYDAVQPSGLKVEFGETRRYTIRRPDHVRVDTDTRDGNQRGIRFDGKAISVFDTNEKVYAIADKSGTIDDAFTYAIDHLQMPLPLAELFASNLPKFTRNLETLAYVEEATIAGARCDHIVGSTKSVDFQVWIAQSEKPLPQRLIITYKRAEGEPQRWAQFRDWNLAPDVADAVFAFTPAEGAERIPFAPRRGTATAAATAPASKGVHK